MISQAKLVEQEGIVSPLFMQALTSDDDNADL